MRSIESVASLGYPEGIVGAPFLVADSKPTDGYDGLA